METTCRRGGAADTSAEREKTHGDGGEAEKKGETAKDMIE